jgi:hypothetical protein
VEDAAMRWLCATLALVMAALAPLPAAAQQSDANAAAQQLILEHNAAGVFEALPSTDQIVLRHPRSGLVCRLDPARRNRLLIFSQAARGEDVACDTSDGNESVTLYATRYSFEVTPEELINGAAAAINERFPDARELPVQIEETSTATPNARTAQFMITRDGTLMFTRVTVALIGQWAIKLRYSVAAPDADAARRGEAAADAQWRATVAELTHQRL